MMATDRFTAAVQYDDWKGASAADNADQNYASNWLKDNGHKKPGEFLVGINVCVGEHYGKHEDLIYVEFLLVLARDFDDAKEKIQSATAPIDVKKVSVKMDVAEFLGLFKRFSVALSRDGLLDGREYTCTDD